MFTSMHHSLVVEPWEALPGGVRVSNVDDPTDNRLLLRDAEEVTRFCATLIATQSLSQARVTVSDDDPDVEGGVQCPSDDRAGGGSGNSLSVPGHGGPRTARDQQPLVGRRAAAGVAVR